ncbi:MULTISPECIES: hypothetical protein [unclassified Azospirillum]|uniref:hypothetical protein n=1 Tax=unclassified Azospirillum TaxID=2630922 RepID=UPI000B6683A9|nr:MULTISPECIES: hypothetical protein [unclassified Azospirillum]SNS26165.1 hypothetical protein SAMN05880556_103213 [Azospirillum sp. RU38E]SNS44641.1 hypothetical protein SAMN05880591_103213 [Azospirillum sp. RU37A]
MPPSGESKLKGVIYGRSLDFRPAPPTAETLGNPIKLTDVEYVRLPQKTWRDHVRLFLQSSGLSTIPFTVRLRWQAHDMVEWLQAALLGKGRARRAAIVHPAQLMPAIDFLMGLPAELDVERRMIHTLVGRALIDYRKRMSAGRERPLLFGKEASNHFHAGFKEQQLLSKTSSPNEQFHTIQRIYNSYYFFRLYYICAIISREPPESAAKLFSKFMRVSFFLSTIQDDGSISTKPSYRQLPPKEHVVFLAKRDAALQARLREDEALRAELQNLLRYFRPLR